MTFSFQKVSNYGSSTPSVARTILQGAPVVDLCLRPESERDDVKDCLVSLQNYLLRCVAIRDQIAKEIEDEKKLFDTREPVRPAARGAVTIPGVGDITGQAESFLQGAKLAIAAAGNLFEPFYKVRHNHKFNKISTWAIERFGPAHSFTKMIASWVLFVSQVVDMRNAVDHPKNEPRGRMHVRNFDIDLNGRLIEPTWGLTGEKPQPLLHDFDTIIENIIRLGESILVGLFYESKPHPSMYIREILLADRDPQKPIRMVVDLRIEE